MYTSIYFISKKTVINQEGRIITFANKNNDNFGFTQSILNIYRLWNLFIIIMYSMGTWIQNASHVKHKRIPGNPTTLAAIFVFVLDLETIMPKLAVLIIAMGIIGKSSTSCCLLKTIRPTVPSLICIQVNCYCPGIIYEAMF